MRFYKQVILPRLTDWSMSSPTLAQYRRQVLAQVQGEVLEIGFGSGLNLSYYPESIRHLVTIDANPGMNQLAQARIARSSIPVENRVLNGENLPMADGTFDSVVSTWTLCSIANVTQALSEIQRVLKPGGRFFFIEHGLSPDPKLQVWQNRLTPLQKVLADGCHFNRNIEQLIRPYFAEVQLEQFAAPGLPKVVGSFYQGVAIKA